MPTVLPQMRGGSCLKISTQLLRKGVLVLCWVVVSALTSNIALAQTSKSISNQSSKTNKMNSTLPPPKSPQEMWDRILMLIKTNNGFVSKDDIERIIGIQFDHTEKDGERGDLGADYLYTAEKELPNIGLVKMGMFAGGRSWPDIPPSNNYHIFWGPERTELLGCLNLDVVTKELQYLGFVAGPRSMVPGGGSVEFTRPEDVERVVERLKNDPKKNYKFSDAIPMLRLWLPTQRSNCVIGFNATAFSPEAN